MSCSVISYYLNWLEIYNDDHHWKNFYLSFYSCSGSSSYSSSYISVTFISETWRTAPNPLVPAWESNLLVPLWRMISAWPSLSMSSALISATWRTAPNPRVPFWESNLLVHACWVKKVWPDLSWCLVNFLFGFFLGAGCGPAKMDQAGRGLIGLTETPGFCSSSWKMT